MLAAISNEHLDAQFPRYVMYDPLVPVWCITPNEGRVIHRFFNSSPISPSGRFVALFRLPYEHREPLPGDEGEVVLIDLIQGSEHAIAGTRGWESQLGANVQWGRTDRELFFNDLDVSSWTPFGVKMDPLSGQTSRLKGCIFSVSADGAKAISADQRTLRRIQAGYGVVIPSDRVPLHRDPPADDGVFATDCLTGERSLVVSTRRAVEVLGGACTLPLPDYAFYIGQCKWNSNGSMFWFQLSGIPKTTHHDFDCKRGNDVIDGIVCATGDGSEIWATLTPEIMSAKKGNHPDWIPGTTTLRLNLDGRSWSRFDILIAKMLAGVRKANNRTLRLSAIRKVNQQLLKLTCKTELVDVSYSGDSLKIAAKGIAGSGHPSTEETQRFVVTDAYWGEAVAFQDGTVPIRVIDTQMCRESVVVRIRSATPWEGGSNVLRCDPHPAWDRQGKWLVFNGFEGGTRRVYIAYMAELLDEIRRQSSE